jgi:hypothetical protein
MNKHIGFRCPDDIAFRLNELKVQTRKDLTTLIVEALNFWLENGNVEQFNACETNPIAPPEREELEQYIKDEVADRTAYLATGINEIKNQLENEIEFLKNRVKKLEESLEAPQVITKPTKINKESAIAAEPVNINAGVPQARLTTDKLGQYAETIQRAMRTNKNFKENYGVENFKIRLDIIKQKILEMYPNTDDWISGDAKKEVIKALIKEHNAQ